MREWLWINPAWDECRLNCQKRDFWVATICFQTYVGEEIKTCISNIGISFNFGKVWKEIFHLSDIKNALLLFSLLKSFNCFIWKYRAKKEKDAFIWRLFEAHWLPPNQPSPGDTYPNLINHADRDKKIIYINPTFSLIEVKNILVAFLRQRWNGLISCGSNVIPCIIF